MKKNNQKTMDMISDFQNKLLEVADELLKENEEKQKEEAERQKKEAELERQKYRKSLKPVYKEEFKKRFAELSKKNAEWEKYKKDNGILFVSVGFEDIAKLVRNAKDEIDYAEILDKTESRLNFLMNDVKESIAEINSAIDFDKIAKELDENDRKYLGLDKAKSINKVFEKNDPSKGFEKIARTQRKQR